MTPVVEILRLWAPFVFLEDVNQTQKKYSAIFKMENLSLVNIF